MRIWTDIKHMGLALLGLLMLLQAPAMALEGVKGGCAHMAAVQASHAPAAMPHCQHMQKSSDMKGMDCCKGKGRHDCSPLCSTVSAALWVLVPEPAMAAPMAAQGFEYAVAPRSARSVGYERSTPPPRIPLFL